MAGGSSAHKGSVQSLTVDFVVAGVTHSFRSSLQAQIEAVHGEKVVPIHPDFRMFVLANRPGFPFLGNDFYRELGDSFSIHVIDNVNIESELLLLGEPVGVMFSMGMRFLDRDLINSLLCSFGSSINPSPSGPVLRGPPRLARQGHDQLPLLHSVRVTPKGTEVRTLWELSAFDTFVGPVRPWRS
jgi:hypothetical protein